MTGPSSQPGDHPAPDPWKSFRGVTAGTLILEAIVVLLALPVVSAVGGGLTPGPLGFLLGLAALLIVLAGLQGRSWAIWVNLGVQLIPIAGFLVYPGVGFIGMLVRCRLGADHLLPVRGSAQGAPRPAARPGRPTGLIRCCRRD